jgi:hypothetical protein
MEIRNEEQKILELLQAQRHQIEKENAFMKRALEEFD